MIEIRDFLKSVLERKGGLVEERESSLGVFLPKDVADRIGTGEYAELLFSPPGKDSGGIYVTYGSELLDRAAALLEDDGKLSGYSLPDLYVKRENLEKEARRSIQFSIPKLRFVDSANRLVSYGLLNFKYAVMADERRDGVLSICTNCSSGAKIDQMEKSLEPLQNDRSPNMDYEIFETLPQDRIYEKACRDAQQEIRGELGDYTKSLSRRLTRDLARVEQYYETLLRELHRRYRKKKLEPEKEKERDERKHAIELEFLLKRKDVERKYGIEIKVTLINVCLIIIPAVVCRMEVSHRRDTRTLHVFWNSVTKAIEPLVCDKCLKDTFAVHSCPALHITCEECHASCSGCRG